MSAPPAVQHTLAEPVRLEGMALFAGRPAKLALLPAPVNHGVVFSRTDLNGARIPGLVSRVTRKARRTALRAGEAGVETVEHLMAALVAMGVDNVLVEVDGPEIPLMDGSAKPFTDAILAAGLAAQEAPRRVLKVTQPVVVRDGDATVAVLPSEEPGLHATFELDLGALGRQAFAVHLDPEKRGADFAAAIAPARTFSMEAEARAAKAAGMFAHLTEEEALVLGPGGRPLGSNQLRFDNEAVRHKLLDLIGDLFLLGAPLQARVVAVRSGHALNHAAARRLARQLGGQERTSALRAERMDVREILRIMPHRYPMLLVDRVLEIDGDQRVLAVKNVTVNEPFFQGHYPARPIMPGVLIFEALAQTAGLLLGQHPANLGKTPLLLSLDRARLRRPVTPGDRLILESEAVRVRSGLAHMRCRAWVESDLAAEAEIKFMLIDEPKA